MVSVKVGYNLIKIWSIEDAVFRNLIHKIIMKHIERKYWVGIFLLKLETKDNSSFLLNEGTRKTLGCAEAEVPYLLQFLFSEKQLQWRERNNKWFKNPWLKIDQKKVKKRRYLLKNRNIMMQECLERESHNRIVEFVQ